MGGVYLLIIMTLVIVFSLGIISGENSRARTMTTTICAQLYSQTSDYLQCTQKDLSEVIKEINNAK